MTAVAIDSTPGGPARTGPCAPSLTAVIAQADLYLTPPEDLYDAEDPHPPRFVGEEDLYDDLPPMSRIDALEWELWAGVDQDEAEREMLRLKAPAWVFLPPGAELAAALETLRPQCESPIALIEAMKAASRMEAWAASIKAAAMASFYRQRKAQAADLPRPTPVDSRGRPIDPERSWEGEIAAALKLSPQTAGRHIDTALHLTGSLNATHTALRCGALTWSKALAISEATRPLSPAATRAVESHVLRRAPGQTHANLNASLRRQVAKHTTRDTTRDTTPGDTDPHKAAHAERTCKIVPLHDGMAGLWVVHTAAKIQQMWIVIQAMADLAKRTTPPPETNPSTKTAPSAAATPQPDNQHTAHHPPTEHPATHHPPTEHPATEHPTTERPAPQKPAAPQLLAQHPAAQRPATAHPAPQKPAAQEPAPQEPAPKKPAAQESAARESAAQPKPTAPQRRADVVADLFEHMLKNGLDWLGRRLPDQHRRRPHIEVLVPITTLLGMDDDPCELTGYGPIPAEMARRIATDGTWRRLLTDPSNGTVLEASTTRHDPGALITETLLARHPVCAWPGCNRTSRECDRDHATPFTQSRQTNLTGLVPYCEYHHVIKDTPAWGWTTTTHPDGSVTLTTPTGHRYTTVPPSRGPIASTDSPAARTASPPTGEPPPF